MPRVVIASKAIGDVVSEHNMLLEGLENTRPGLSGGVREEFLACVEHWLSQAKRDAGALRRDSLCRAAAVLILEIEKMDRASFHDFANPSAPGDAA